jgi:hypothetical protein
MTNAAIEKNKIRITIANSPMLSKAIRKCFGFVYSFVRWASTWLIPPTRKYSGLVYLFVHWVTAGAFSVYWWLEYRNAISNNVSPMRLIKVLGFVVAADLFSASLGTIRHCFEESDAKAAKAERNAARMEIYATQRQAADAMRHALASKRKWDELGTITVMDRF